MITELLRDFERATAELPQGHRRADLTACLAEAIQRVAPAVHDQPTTAFQELWRADPPAGAWTEPQNEFQALLGRWRAEKAAAQPGFLWLRAKRPPRVPLGGALIWRAPAHHGAVGCVCWLPCARTVVSGGADGRVHFWDRQTALPIGTFTSGSSPIRALASSPTAALVAAAAGGAIDIIDSKTQQLVASVRPFPCDPCLSLAFSPDGRELAAGAENSTAVIVNCIDWSVARQRVLPLGGVTQLAWSGAAEYLACAGANGAIVVARADTLDPCSTFVGHQEPPWNAADNPLASISIGNAAPRRTVTGMCWFANTDVIASVGDDNAIRIWDATTGECHTVLNAPWSGDRRLSASPSGRHFAVSETWGQRVLMFDRASGQMVARVDIWDHDVLCLGWSPAQSCLVAGDAGGCVTLFGRGRDPSHRLRFDHRDEVDEMALSEDGAWLVTHGDEGAFHVWDTDTAEPVIGARDSDVLAWKLGGGVRSDDPREQAALDALMGCVVVRLVRGPQDARYDGTVAGAYAHFQAAPDGYVNWGIRPARADAAEVYESVRRAEGLSLVDRSSRMACFHLHGRYDRVLVQAERRLLVCVSSRVVDIFSLEGASGSFGDRPVRPAPDGGWNTHEVP